MSEKTPCQDFIGAVKGKPIPEQDTQEIARSGYVRKKRRVEEDSRWEPSREMTNSNKIPRQKISDSSDYGQAKRRVETKIQSPDIENTPADEQRGTPQNTAQKSNDGHSLLSPSLSLTFVLRGHAVSHAMCMKEGREGLLTLDQGPT